MKNRITDLLGTRYPLMMGPMRLITLGEMAAGVSESGGFGQIAASGASAEMLRDEIARARSLTKKPFGMNIPIHRPNALEALEIAIESGIGTITTSGGNPAKIIDKVKNAGLRILHKVSTVKMALKAQEAVVDGVIATGYEAGGHVGRENITTFCLVPLLVDALNIPVVAAGGIVDGRGVLAALALGAEGVEVGTRFVCTRECSTPDWYKQAILDSQDASTLVLGKDVMPIRVLKNKKAIAVADPDKAREDEKMRSGGEDDYVGGDADEAIMPAGQAASLIRDIKRVMEVFPDMMDQAKQSLFRLDLLLKE